MSRTQVLGAVLFAAVLAVTTVSVQASEPYAYNERFDQTYALAANGTVSLDNVNGDVRIEVWDQNEVRVEAEKYASSQELLDQLEIKVEAGDGAISIDTKYPKHGSWSDKGERSKVEYKLTVPRTAELDGIDLVNGDLTVIGALGGLDVDMVNGEIDARQVGGRLQLSTVNGAVTLQLDSFDQLTAVELESVNGTVELAIPSWAAASFNVETVNGSIHNSLGLTVNKHKYVGSDLRAAVNGGGTTIDIETVNGTVKINNL